MMRLWPLAAFLPTPLLRDEEGVFPTPQTFLQWHNWTWELSIVIPLLMLMVWYVIGAARRGRQPRIQKHHLSFVAGWGALCLALVSPLHRLGDVLFSAHMLQHEILLLVAAPLFSAAHPGVTFLYALPASIRRPVGGAIANIERSLPFSFALSATGAFLLHAAALWLWHIPYLYQAAVESDIVHALQHLSFFLSGILFWSALYGAGRSKMTYGAGVVYVFGTAAHCSALGALLTFSSLVWYPIYANRTELWNLTPLQDQQLGGLLMWVPSGVVFIAIGIWLFYQWLVASERSSKLSMLAKEENSA